MPYKHSARSGRIHERGRWISHHAAGEAMPHVLLTQPEEWPCYVDSQSQHWW
jgi:hypothetical protein